MSGDNVRIKFVGVTKSFEEHKVLDNVDMEIKGRETIVIIGRSGSGKSVLLKHIIGLMRPDRGKIYIDNLEITGMDEKELNKVREKFGMLFQSAALFDSLTVRENVAFGLRRQANLNNEEIEKIVKEKLALVELENVQDMKPAELSGGMRKRVGLARAIAMDPHIVLYDEPTTGLDPIMADAINNLIRDLQKKLDITSIVVTHDMVSAYKIADRIAMLYEGKIIEIGTTDEIKNTKNPVVKQFITGSAHGPIKH